jgi:hypothetical protein
MEADSLKPLFSRNASRAVKGVLLNVEIKGV